MATPSEMLRLVPKSKSSEILLALSTQEKMLSKTIGELNAIVAGRKISIFCPGTTWHVGAVSMAGVNVRVRQKELASKNGRARRPVIMTVGGKTDQDFCQLEPPKKSSSITLAGLASHINNTTQTQSSHAPLTMAIMRRLSPTWLLVLSLWIAAVSSFHGRPVARIASSVRTSHYLSIESLWIPRGGSSEEQDYDFDSDDQESDEEEDFESDDDEEVDSDEEDSDDEEEESDEEEDSEADETPLSSVISSEPLTVIVKTNIGNRVVDQSMELLVSRTRDIASVKNTLSRQLPGRPPASALTLMSGPRVLGDEELVDELVDDEDEDEEGEENDTLVLTLDMVPPVDPKFATTLALDEMTTSEILDAYSANAAAMYNNAQSLVSEPSADKAFGSLSIQLRHEAYRIRDQLTTAFPESALAKLEDDTPPAHETQAVEQRRGQRYRSGRGGAKTNMKRTIQRNLNVVR